MIKRLSLGLVAAIVLACSMPLAQNLPGPIPTAPSMNPPINFYLASLPGVVSIFGNNPNSGIQGNSILITGANLTNFLDFNVADVNYVNVMFNGFTGWSTANNFQTNSLHCAANDDVGVASTLPCNSVWLTTSVQSPTVLRVTAHRSGAGDSTVTAFVNVFVSDLNPALVAYSVRGTAATGSPATIPNCPNIFHLQTTWLGTDGIDVHTPILRSNNTTVSATNGFSGNDFPGVTAAFQSICWN